MYLKLELYYDDPFIKIYYYCVYRKINILR